MNGDLKQVIENVHASDDFVTAHIYGDHGRLGGVIIMQNIGIDTSWGERRDQWNWLVVGSRLTVLGGSTGPFDALKGGCDATTTGPIMLGSFLSYCGAQAESASDPSSENYTIFPPAVRDWCVEFVSELAWMQVQLDDKSEWEAGAPDPTKPYNGDSGFTV